MSTSISHNSWTTNGWNLRLFHTSYIYKIVSMRAPDPYIYNRNIAANLTIRFGKTHFSISFRSCAKNIFTIVIWVREMEYIQLSMVGTFCTVPFRFFSWLSLVLVILSINMNSSPHTLQSYAPSPNFLFLFSFFLLEL